MTRLADLKKELKSASDKDYAIRLQGYFKTGPGEYGEGDKFIGVRDGPLRKLARSYRDLSRADIKSLLHSPIHEQRALALIILVEQFSRADETAREKIYRFYMTNLKRINNWDLVDVSAPKIVGAHLYDKSRKPLHDIARSSHLWSRRVAMLSTLYFIRKDDFADTIKIAHTLLNDEHDLIHKAVGWMLREVGKRDQRTEEQFLKRYYQDMPRTMLRYAIERFPEKRRKAYLEGRIRSTAK